MTERLLVAGIGNIFFSDDGFGSAVIQRLGAQPIAGARLEDYGIRGMHLAFDILAGYERVIVVDALTRGGTPGTLCVIEPDTQVSGPPLDAHRMDLPAVLAFVRSLGGSAPPIEIVGCEPQSVDEGIGLSAAVSAAIDGAATLVRLRIETALAATSRDKEETPCLEA